MAGSSPLRMFELCNMCLALLLLASALNAGVTAGEEEVVTGSTLTVDTAAVVRGDMIPEETDVPETKTLPGQIVVFPTFILSTSAQTPKEEPGTGAQSEEGGDLAVPAGSAEPKVEVQTEGVEMLTQAPQPARGDGPDITPAQPASQSDVTCVTKEAVQDKDAVHLKLKTSSSCEDSRAKIASVLQQLCGEDCKLDLFQEENSNQVLVAGQYVQDDAAGMAEKFNNDNIKDKTDVEEAAPRWGKSSKLVLVSLLLTGLLLAALLVAGYYVKTHRKSTKGVRLAESFQVDEENPANTLVSVAPLPQEPVDKPTINGEAPPPENGTNPAAATNGHSPPNQTPVADTAM